MSASVTALITINALSFHSIPTTNQPSIPIAWKIRLDGKMLLLVNITPIIKRKEATHLIYQSMVYLGVADLNILFEFASSSLEISLGFFSFNIIVYLFPVSNYTNSFICIIV